MALKNLFDDWLSFAKDKYADRQWLLSKWEIREGIVWPEKKIRIMMESIVRGLDLKKDHALIDLGCGGGWILNFLNHGLSNPPIGLDFCRPMLESARKLSPNAAFVQGEIGRLPFKNESFDRVLCYFVLINMMDDALIFQSISDIYRIVRKSGVVLIGQLPDKDRSKMYDKAKADYAAFCESHYRLGPSIRDVAYMPQKLFDIPKLRNYLERSNISYELRPSFNPFYREGESETVDWRFDLILKK
nr:SAM-dependent Methyltransferase 11 [uncultured bacterium]